MDTDTPGSSDSPGPVLVSACLWGVACTYEGRDEERSDLAEALEGRDVIPVCPEVLAGLGVPRPRCEVDAQGKVTTTDGRDVTDEFRAGAAHTLELAREHGADLAVLKHKSPSCGCRGTYDGTHTHTWAPDGVGVTAALLIANGIECITEDEAVSEGADGRDG